MFREPLKLTPQVRRLIKWAFPDYRGRKVFLSRWGKPQVLRTWWCEGSRSYYVLVGPDGARRGKTFHPLFDGGLTSREVWEKLAFDLPPQHILLEREIFRGKEAGIIIWYRPEDWQGGWPPMLPAPERKEEAK